MSNFSISIFLAISLFGCVHNERPRSKPASTVGEVAKEWRLEDRTACLGDWIKFRFFAGNVRTGRLAPSDNSGQLPIEGTDDAGIYEIREIQWIECGGRLVYPARANR